MSGICAVFAPAGEAVVKTTLSEVIQRAVSAMQTAQGQLQVVDTVALLIDSSKLFHASLHGQGGARKQLSRNALHLLAHASTPRCMDILDALYVTTTTARLLPADPCPCAMTADFTLQVPLYPPSPLR